MLKVQAIGRITGLPDAVRKSILPKTTSAGLLSSESWSLSFAQLSTSLSGTWKVFDVILISEKCLIRCLAQFDNICLSLEMSFPYFAHYAISMDAYSSM